MAAFLIGDLVRGRLGRARHDRVHRLDDEEEDRCCRGDERDQRGDERAVAEDRIVDREGQPAEVGLAEDHRHDRHDQIVDERGDQRGEREADDQCDGELEEVAAQEKVLELLEHGGACLSVS
ncbi:MAG TPA: hypothetical protein VEW90_04000 [Gaiellaceae bacterium]|nr:hypothetical protein [Gaiellaceae bacterium]